MFKKVCEMFASWLGGLMEKLKKGWEMGAIEIEKVQS